MTMILYQLSKRYKLDKFYLSTLLNLRLLLRIHVVLLLDHFMELGKVRFYFLHDWLDLRGTLDCISVGGEKTLKPCVCVYVTYK